MIATTRLRLGTVLLCLLAACTAGETRPERAQDDPGSPPDPMMSEAGPMPAAEVLLADATRFSGTDGEEVLAEPGVYRVSAKDGSLTLDRVGVEDVLRLSAAPVSHERDITEAHAAVLYQEEGNGRGLRLLRPDGTGLETIGFVGESRPRGWVFRTRVYLPASLTAKTPTYGEEYWQRTRPLTVTWSASRIYQARLYLIRHGDNRPLAISGVVDATKGSYSWHGLHHLPPQWYRLVVESYPYADHRSYGSWFHVRGPATTIAEGTNHRLALRERPSSTAMYAGVPVWRVWARASTSTGAPSAGGAIGAWRDMGVDALAVAAGHAHSLAVRSDGRVYTWGMNYGNQCGFSGPSEITSPRLTSLTGVVAVAGGNAHSVALRSDGTVWTWGSNDKGQCARPTSYSRITTPTQVRFVNGSLLTSVVAIAAGGDHTVVLRSNGVLYAWGSNEHGQIDAGATGLWQVAESPRPVLQSHLSKEFVSIAAGKVRSAALGKYGRHLVVWGDQSTSERSPVEYNTGDTQEWVYDWLKAAVDANQSGALATVYSMSAGSTTRISAIFGCLAEAVGMPGDDPLFVADYSTGGVNRRKSGNPYILRPILHTHKTSRDLGIFGSINLGLANERTQSLLRTSRDGLYVWMDHPESGKGRGWWEVDFASSTGIK